MKRFESGETGPLGDVRVLDLSRLVAGNMLTAYLADFGADVIKVERPGPVTTFAVGASAARKSTGRCTAATSVRSCSISSREAGLLTLKELVPHSQMLVENFVPGGLEKMGLGPDVLFELNPALVIIRVSGWGQTGPFSHKPGFGTLVEAMSGLRVSQRLRRSPAGAAASRPGRHDRGGLRRSGCTHGAAHCGEGKGRGQVIDLSLFEPIFSVIASEAAKCRLNGVPNHAFWEPVDAHRAAQRL